MPEVTPNADEAAILKNIEDIRARLSNLGQKVDTLLQKVENLIRKIG